MKKIFSITLALMMALSSLSAGLTAFAREIHATDEDGYETVFEINDSNITSVYTEKVTATKATITWNFQTWADDYGFEILLDEGSKGDFSTVIDCRVTSSFDYYEYTLRNLKAATYYSFKIRYYQIEYGVKYYGNTSGVYAFATAPEATALLSAKYVKKGKIKVKWKKAVGATGYLVQYSTSKKFKSGYTDTVDLKSNKSTYTVGGLAKAKYYFRILPYKTAGKNEPSVASASNVKTAKVKKGCTLKQTINYTKTGLSGRKRIKRLTKNGVDIKKYKSTYSRIKAIYNWHAKHYKDFSNCLECNSHFNDCIYALYDGVKYQDGYVTIAAGRFKNLSGSTPIHKWSVLFFAGKPYIFDPRMQGYTGNFKGNTYFGIPFGSKAAKKRYIFEGWF